jgi:hypothetical protein
MRQEQGPRRRGDDESASRITRAKIMREAWEDAGVIDIERSLEYFRRCLSEREAREGSVTALRSFGDRRILEKLAGWFWLYGRSFEDVIKNAWGERRDNAVLLSSKCRQALEPIETLIRREAFITATFKVYGTGRLAARDIGTGKSDFCPKLLRLLELISELTPTLEQLSEKRKPRIDHDEDLILYVMKAFLDHEFHGSLSLNAICKEIALFVNSWGDALIDVSDDKVELYEKDIGRRIQRFREHNTAAAGCIDANPSRYITQILVPIFRNGLRPEHALSPRTLNVKID